MPSRALAGLTLGILVTLSGCTSPARTPDPPAGGDTSAADTAFVRSMIAYHQHSLAVLALADTRAADTQVKTLAAQTAGLQRLQQTTMVTLLSGWAQPTVVPAAEPDSHQADLAVLVGAAFDRALLTAMISHNADAVDIARHALADRLGESTRRIASAVEKGLSAENTALRDIASRLDSAGRGIP